MNSYSRWITAIWLVLSLFGLKTTAELRAQTNAAARAAHPLANERFLLVIETSSATEKRAENVQKVAGAVLAGGLNGHILPGCSVGIWTFNNQLHTGQFPLRVWTPDARREIARSAVQFLQQQKYEKAPRLADVQATLATLLAQSERLTVIYVTSGSEPITGTNEDPMIAETFRANAGKQRDLQMPFVTIVRATKGQVVATAVTTPPWSLEIPEYPDVPKPSPADLAPPAPVVVTPPPVAARVNPGLLSPTNMIFLVETAAPPVQSVTAPKVESLPEVPAPNVVATAPLPVAVPKTNSAPEIVSTVAASPNSKAPGVAAPVAVPGAGESPRFTTLLWLSAGIAVLLVVLVFMAAQLRRPRRREKISLITHSLQRHQS